MMIDNCNDARSTMPAAEIKAVLDEMHRELRESGCDNGLMAEVICQPYEDKLKAITEKFAVDYDIEWNNEGGTREVALTPAPANRVN